MYCYKCGKELPDGSGFCKYCGVAVSSAPAKTSAMIHKNYLRFALIGLAALCALLLLQCFRERYSINITFAETAEQLIRQNGMERYARMLQRLNLVAPLVWILGAPGAGGMLCSAIAIALKMEGSRRLLRFSLILSILAGLAVGAEAIIWSGAVRAFTEALLPFAGGVLLCALAGLFVAEAAPDLVSYPAGASRSPASDMLVVLVFFLGLGLAHNVCGVFSISYVGGGFGYLALEALNALNMPVNAAWWPFAGAALLLCGATGFVLRKQAWTGVLTCAGVGGATGVVQAVAYYLAWQDSVALNHYSQELLALADQMDHYIPIQLILFQCLLGLFIGMAMNGRLRLRFAIIIPVVYMGLRILLTYVFVFITALGLFGDNIAYILSLILSIALVCLFGILRKKREVSPSRECPKSVECGIIEE